ncbi:hypothetical protein VHUM_00737 [Vanrija humicola]|uniref:Uncharacterized protein n=1 Tax=Vanrija humicola TaxID=5417 RepID=A0A7D8Z326_VANHU|nr:hypothetical protein VHUM_00737 [Vanrija humicola]
MLPLAATQHQLGRAYTTGQHERPQPTPPAPSSSPTALSPRLQRYAPRLAQLAARTGVPLPSLAVSFLVLHELTAVLPVVLLYYVFSALGAGAAVVAWLAGDKDAAAHWAAEGREGASGTDDGERTWTHKVHEWYREGLGRAERVGRRYGLLGYDKGSKGDGTSAGAGASAAVADAVAAYVVVKALLPLRIAVSVAAAPAFARLALRPWRALTARLRRAPSA